MNHIAITGTIVTKANAASYLERVATTLLADLTMEASTVLSQIERKLMDAGFLTPIECEAIEIKAMKEA